jgi:hypothetical protein
MEYINSAISLIKTRKSIRTYEESMKIELKKQGQLIDYMSILNTNSFRFRSIQNSENHKDRNNEYGFIKGVRYLIIGIINNSEDKDPQTLVEFGLNMEKVVLKATDLGLGTCWVTNITKGAYIRREANLKLTERIAAVITIGYPSEKMRKVERIIEEETKDRNRKGWSELFFNEDFKRELTFEEAGNYKEALEAVRLAPSAVNYQPWRVIKMGNRFDFFALRNSYRLASKVIPYRYSDMGIAFAHFELACEELELDGSWCHCEEVADEKYRNIEYIRSWKMRSNY